MHYAGSKTMLMAQPGGELTPTCSSGSSRRSQSGMHQHRFDGLTALHLVYPITDQGQVIGHLYVRANLSELQERADRAARHPARQLGGRRSRIAYLLARRVQHQIAAPLMHLVDVMRPPSAATIRSAPASPATTRSVT